MDSASRPKPPSTEREGGKIERERWGRLVGLINEVPRPADCGTGGGKLNALNRRKEVLVVVGGSYLSRL